MVMEKIVFRKNLKSPEKMEMDLRESNVNLIPLNQIKRNEII